MERGAEPWSWALDTSSAGSHDFHPGVVLRRESCPHPPPAPCPSRVPLLPALTGAHHRSPCNLRQDKDLCVY